MCHVRRGVMTGVVTRAAAGALLAALAATDAPPQSPKPPVNGLRPAFEDAGDEPDNLRVKPPLRRDRQNSTPGGTQAPGTLPGFGSPENGQIPRFGNPAGSGAGRTGFMSINGQRRPGTPARAIVRVPGTLAPPVPLGSGTSGGPAAPAGSFSTMAPVTGARINPPDSRTTKAIAVTNAPPAALTPRAKLVQI